MVGCRCLRGAADPWAPGGEYEANRFIHASLLRAGLDVITDLNPEIFHQKFVVRGPGHATAAVLTSSTNFTATDTSTNSLTGRGGGNNLNHGWRPPRTRKTQLSPIRSRATRLLQPIGSTRRRWSTRAYELRGARRACGCHLPDRGC